MNTSNVTSPGARRKPRDESPVEKTVASPAIAETGTAQWQRLYRVGGAAALLAAGLEIVAALLGVIASSTVGPPPSTVIGWFTLLQQHRFVGLLDLGLFDIAALTLLVPMFLAVYVALRGASATTMALATILAVIGIAVYLATETAFSLLSLSSQYAAAATSAQRSLILAAGQGMLAEEVGPGTGTFMAFMLIGIAGLIVAAVMFHGGVFGNVTAWVGILANAIVLVYYLGLAFASIPQAVGAPAYWISGLLSLLWYILIGWRLLQLAKENF
ncbi:MAG: hypothetical protein ACLQUY_25490 [Ktedonobacterales bacterium]